jgi:glucose/arabinose dehydrogenase
MTRIPGASVVLLALVGLFTPAVTQQGTDPASDEDLKQNFAAEHEIGRRFQIDPNNLPAPKTGPIVTNRSLVVPYAGQAPSVPEGFSVIPFATGLANPRRLLVLPNGDILVAEQSVTVGNFFRDMEPVPSQMGRSGGMAVARRESCVTD